MKTVNLRANASFKAGAWASLEALIVPKLVAGATSAANQVFAISQELVHVRTGELKSSGSVSVTWSGTKVTGAIKYTAGHAAYNEFGTGRRGAASEWAGPYEYKQSWPGMTAIPFLRPALDQGRSLVLDAFKNSL